MIPKTTSISTFSPVRRCRCRRNTCRQPGQSSPKYSSSQVVNSSVRFSIRPCPLSTVVARSMQAARRTALEGGKAGLGLGESGRDVGPQRRSVVLHRQDVVPAPLDHAAQISRCVNMASPVMRLPLMGRIPSSSSAALVLVGLGIDPKLGQDRLDIRGVGGDKVDCGGLAVAAAAEGLAIDGQMGRVARPESAADPAGDGRLEGGDVHAAEDAGVGGLAEAAAAGEAQELKELPPRSLP